MKLSLSNTTEEEEIDLEDYEKVKNWTWRLHKSSGGFVVRTSGGKTYSLHRVITGCSSDKVVDHINHNKLDNRKGNLRICTIKENSRNKSFSKNNTSGFKGVCWYKRRKVWAASIKVDREQKHLGYFSDRREAANAYNQAALRYFGEFAYLNAV